MRARPWILLTYQIQANAISTIDTKASEINGHTHYRSEILLPPLASIAATINGPPKSKRKSTTPTNTGCLSHGCQRIQSNKLQEVHDDEVSSCANHNLAGEWLSSLQTTNKQMRAWSACSKWRDSTEVAYYDATRISTWYRWATRGTPTKNIIRQIF